MNLARILVALVLMFSPFVELGSFSGAAG